MTRLTFDVVGGGPREIEVRHLLNAGYAGRDSAKVQAHIDELAELGVPGPGRIPTLYPLASTLASQQPVVQVPHGRTSGEAEWALIVGDGPDDLLLTAACDHTDRALEVHGVAWSKQSAPDLLGRTAWNYADVEDSFDAFRLRAWVRHDGAERLIQDGTPGELLSPGYWLEQLDGAGLRRPGTVLLSGTLAMVAGVDQFGDGWRVELRDPEGRISEVAYALDRLPAAWE